MTLDDLRCRHVNRNVRAFLAVVRYALHTWGTAGYRPRRDVHGAQDWLHPMEPIPQQDGTLSTRAGAFAIDAPTWLRLSSDHGFDHFGHVEQELSAVSLLHESGALPEIIEGHVAMALHRARHIWPELMNEPSHHAERGITMERAMEVYLQFGGEFHRTSFLQAEPVLPRRHPLREFCAGLGISLSLWVVRRIWRRHGRRER